MENTAQSHALQEKLLQWYDSHRRIMPWRALPGRQADPYHVWLSEIMLQQTTVAAVKPYFERFVSRWPKIDDLAAASQDEVLQVWAGLGYYARARNLHKCAQVIMAEYGGRFPQDYAALLKLPGIGPYTAAAVASIAFNKQHVAVDGNVERVTARLYAVKTALPAAKADLKIKAEALGADNPRPADFTQAFMELGATVCTPTSPKCSSCPWQQACKAFAFGLQDELPRRLKKKKRPVKHATVFWIENDNAEVLLRRRPQEGLLGGMMEFPTSVWQEDKVKGNAPPVPAMRVIRMKESVRHIFTHLELNLEIEKYSFTGNLPDGAYKWCSINRLSGEALPSLMRKVAKQVIGKENA